MKPIRVPLLTLLCYLTIAAHARAQSPVASLGMIRVPSEQQARELRSRILAGESFETLAMQHSVDPSAALAGATAMPQLDGLSADFRQTLADLRPGIISPIFRVDDNFLFVKLATPEETRWSSVQRDAQAALMQGRLEEATILFKSAVGQAEEFGQDDVRLAQSLNGLASAYSLTRNPGEADGLARRALSILERALGPSHRSLLPALANLAGTAKSAGRYGEAERHYRRMLAIRWGPSSAAATVLDKFAEVLNLGYTRDPALTAAVADYRKGIAEVPLEKGLYRVMRDGLMTVTLVGEAEFVMKHAVTLYPESVKIRYELGEFYAKCQKYRSALDTFQQAARLGSQFIALVGKDQLGLIHEKIAEMALQLVRFDDAIAALHQALSLNPESPSAHVLLGALYLRRNEFELAAAEFRNALAIYPDLADAYEGLAQVSLATGHFDEAVREAERALDADPQFQRARYTLGIALVRSGRTARGRDVLRAYREREEQIQDAASPAEEVDEANLSVSALLEERLFGDALAVLKESIRLHPGAAVLQLRQALIQSRMGRHNEAIVTLQSMAERRLDYFLVHHKLAQEYALVGDTAASQRQRVLYIEQFDAALQLSAN